MTDIVRDAIAASIAALPRTTRTPTDPLNYGIDLVCRDDLDPRLRECDPESTESIAQDAYHKITTRRGTLPDDAGYGKDVREYLSGPTDASTLQTVSDEIASAIGDDDRIADVECSVTCPTLKEMRIILQIEPQSLSLGPFTLIITVTDGATHLEILNG